MKDKNWKEEYYKLAGDFRSHKQLTKSDKMDLLKNLLETDMHKDGYLNWYCLGHKQLDILIKKLSPIKKQ